MTSKIIPLAFSAAKPFLKTLEKQTLMWRTSEVHGSQSLPWSRKDFQWRVRGFFGANDMKLSLLHLVFLIIIGKRARHFQSGTDKMAYLPVFNQASFIYDNALDSRQFRKVGGTFSELVLLKMLHLSTGNILYAFSWRFMPKNRCTQRRQSVISIPYCCGLLSLWQSRVQRPFLTKTR